MYFCSERSKGSEQIVGHDAWGLQFARLFGAKLDLKAHDDEVLAAAADEYWCEGQTCRQHEALPFKATQLFFEAVYDAEGGMCQRLALRLFVCRGSGPTQYTNGPQDHACAE